MRELDDLTEAIIDDADDAIRIHRDPGPGLLEIPKARRLLLNFGENTLAEDLHRVVNASLRLSATPRE
jgi:hypothetical protein